MKTQAAVLYEMGKPTPYAGSQPLMVEDLELKEPGSGELLVEIAYAGLCHSDLSVIDGSRPRPMPMVLGHEASGIVRAAGPEVTDLKSGDHIVFSPVPSCGFCVPCASGRPALCTKGAEANSSGTLLAGDRHFMNGEGREMNHHVGVAAFSRYTVAAKESLVKLDPEVPLDKAALFGCAVSTGVGAVVNTAKVEPGRSVAVFGLGGVGLCAVMGARAAGAWPIVAIDQLNPKLELARRLGASHTVNSSVDDTIEAVTELTRGGADYAIECVGNEKVLHHAYTATRPGGTTVAVGLSHPSKEFSASAVSLVAEERTLKGSYLGSGVPRRDVPRFIEMYNAGLLPIDQLITCTIRFDDINHAFDALARGDVVRQLLSFP